MGQPRKGFRDPAEVQGILLRMGTQFVDALDHLCDTNNRSRREIVEILVNEVHLELGDAKWRIFTGKAIFDRRELIGIEGFILEHFRIPYTFLRRFSRLPR